MIFTWLITPILTIMTDLLSLLPASNESWFASADNYASAISGYATSAGMVLPVALMLSLMYVVVIVFIPSMVVFELTLFAYKHFPELFGTGPK